MNIYILLDTSGSIQKEDFDVSRNATIALIRKVCAKKQKIYSHILAQRVCNVHVLFIFLPVGQLRGRVEIPRVVICD